MKRIILIFSTYFFLCGTIHSQEVDSTRNSHLNIHKLREKYENKSLWDQIFSVPGQVLFFPVELILEGTKQTIIFVDNSKIIPRTVDLMTSDDGKRGIVPTYASRTGAGFKFYQKSIFSEQSEFSAKMSVGLHYRQNYEIELEKINLYRGTFFATLKTEYRLLPTESFYGIGSDTREADKTTYSHELIWAEAFLGYKINNSSKLETSWRFEINNILNGEEKEYPSISKIYASQNLPGLATEIKMLRFEAGIFINTKDRPGNPTAGLETTINGGVYTQVVEDRYGFWKWAVDFTKYIHLFYDRVLVLRTAGEFTDRFTDHQVPFFYLSELGPQETIRGFSRGRFRDLDYILGSVEYRFPVSRGLDALIFADAGQVSSDIYEKYSHENLEITYGGGLRLWSKNGLIAKLEIGRSKDGFRVMFNLN